MRANDSKLNGVSTVLLGMAAIALAGMVGTIGLIREVGEFGPKVGDIVAFDPLDPMSNDMKARVSAIPADHHPGGACVLDVRTMHADGGSVIIESRQPVPGYNLRVHWAGRHSANGGTDCGSSAELLLNQDDIEVLAMAAGGYGTPASKHARASFWGTTDPIE